MAPGVRPYTNDLRETAARGPEEFLVHRPGVEPGWPGLKPGILAVRAPGPSLEEKFPGSCFKQAETAEMGPEFIVRDTAQ